MDKIWFALRNLRNDPQEEAKRIALWCAAVLRNLCNDPREKFKMIVLSCAAGLVLSYIAQTLLVPVIAWLGAEWKLWVCLAENAPSLGLIMLTEFVSTAGHIDDYACTEYKKLPDHLRIIYAACVMCQYLVRVDRTSSWFFWLFDLVNYTLQGWLLLANEYELRKLEERLAHETMNGLHETLALVIFCLTSVEYGFNLGSKVFPAFLGRDVVILFAISVFYVNMSWCAALKKAGDSQHKHWQRYFLWASLWVQLDFSALEGASGRLGNASTVVVSVAIMYAITKATDSLPPCSPEDITKSFHQLCEAFKKVS